MANDDEEGLIRSVALQNAQAIHLARQRAEEALRAQTEWLRVTLASIGDAVITTGADGRVTFLNRVAETLTGRTRTEAIGLPLPDVFRIVNESTRQPVENPALRALREGVVVGLANHTILIARDGTERPIDDSAAPMRNEAGAVVGTVLVFRDITDRRRADSEREQLLREVQTERKRLAEVFERSPAFVAVLRGPDHVFERANDRYYRLIGRRDVIGKPVQEALPELVSQGFLEVLDNVYRTGEAFVAMDARVSLRRGAEGTLEEFHLEFVFQPLRDSDEAVSGILVHGIDLTARTKADESLRRVTAESEQRKRLYETLLSSTPDFGYVFSLDHRFLYANEALLSMYGRTWDTTIGKSLLELGYEPWHAEMHEREIDEVRSTKKPIRGEVPFTGTLGRRIYDYIFVPIFGPDGEVEAVAGTTRDVTDRKAAEDSLRESDRRKDEFLALLAHELRNPLAPLRNGLQVVRLSQDQGVRERSQDMMERQLGHMVRLVDDLLDISRVSRNKMDLRLSRIVLSEVIRSAIETARPLIDAAGHHIELALPREAVYLNADLTRLAQVFANLLTNSAKYTDRGGRIRIAVKAQDRTVTIVVQDNGIGIPASSLKTIFDMFSQVDRSIERSTGGLGIGLALVKGLVEMHGGTIDANSPGPGRGSTFTIRLPIMEHIPESTHARLTSSEERPLVASRRLLVVDDNRDGAESLAEMLRLLGHSVEMAHDGIEGVRKAEEYRPEIVLMDVGMPRLNGLDATRRIREQPWGRFLTIIALTGWGQDADRALSKDAGCDGHLVKPVNLTELAKVLKEPVKPGFHNYEQ